MRHNKFLAALFPLALVFFFASYAYAASPGTNATLEFVENFTSGIGDKLLGYARSLFVGLATLSLAMGLGKMILSGESNIGSVAAHVAKWIIYVGVFFWIMSSSGVATFLPKLIVNSFMEAGKSISGQDVAPDDLLVAGIRLYGTMVERGWDAGWGDFIGIMLIGIVILVVVAMLAGTMAVALIEMHLVICGGAILIGFGGFEYTRDIALSYLRYSVSIGVKLLMIMIVMLSLMLYSLTGKLILSPLLTWALSLLQRGKSWAALSVFSWLLKWFRLWLSLSSAAWLCPSVMSCSIPLLLVSLTELSAKKNPGGGRSGGLLGAGKTVVQSLRNAQTATFRGIADTYDAAKEGGFSGAIEHVASHLPVVNNLIDAHKGGNMLNYVAASTVFGSHSERATRYLHNDDTPEMRPAPKNENPNSQESSFERLNNNERS